MTESKVDKARRPLTPEERKRMTAEEKKRRLKAAFKRRLSGDDGVYLKVTGPPEETKIK